MGIKDIKIIFIDLDGTSLDYKHKLLSKKNLEIINKCREKNIKVVVSTGRGLNQKTWDILNQINDNSNIIAWNGAKIIKNNKEVFSSAIPQKILDEIAVLIRKYRISTVVNSDFKNHSYTDSKLMRLVIKLKRSKAKPVSKFKPNFEIFKLIFIPKSKKMFAKFRNELTLKFKNELNILDARSYTSFIEVTDKNASKGIAEVLFSRLDNVLPQNCIHIGDTMNDSTTVGKIKYVIAMKNATKEFKKIANFISPYSFKSGGLAKTINHFLFNEK
ncbi:HAD family phosphatase [Mycoplasmopsis phocirhinis]|uniref:HAD family phosphatase n=1 Tax=Mycoplasmopsis phocirhinis TaxID=142650 RepID=A0A4P6MSK9_9BACT|nr:HAD family hydrolase [Mycoplasmopsis phocirhinis]QBF34851.1 HAD family phosphatase [Mycoplasmopsis phocirhinis]